MRQPLRRSTAVAWTGVTACAVALLTVPPASAAGTLTVSKTTGLAVGDTVTVSAKGLSASQPFVPLGLCKPDPAGPTDCDTSADSAVIGKTDASGVWHSSSDDSTTAKITIKAKAGGADCTASAGACVIAVFITATEELVQQPLTVSASGGGSSPSASASTSADPSASASASTGGSGSSGSGTSGGSSTDDSLAQTGSLDGIPVGLLGAGTLTLVGTSAQLLMPRRRRRQG
ncbi:neocarzinostatin apoprotein domain-containing protein [Streptomyces sp. NPDC090106]|uniref:neocarzinostatin apoprotein domain-containing protein n=1 Tax=Streptomyces sp. NPDC090106 TaxID=3365946 RepID=UPI003808AC9F